jgi:hypothetical protein
MAIILHFYRVKLSTKEYKKRNESGTVYDAPTQQPYRAGRFDGVERKRSQNARHPGTALNHLHRLVRGA